MTTGIDPSVAPSGAGCVECDAARRLVGAPAPLRAVRPRRLLRLLPPQHATAHYRATGHPVMQSFEPGEDWFWDYARGEASPTGRSWPPPTHHPVDQSVPGPAGRVPADWQRHVH